LQVGRVRGNPTSWRMGHGKGRQGQITKASPNRLHGGDQPHRPSPPRVISRPYFADCLDKRWRARSGGTGDFLGQGADRPGFFSLFSHVRWRGRTDRLPEWGPNGQRGAAVGGTCGGGQSMSANVRNNRLGWLMGPARPIPTPLETVLVFIFKAYGPNLYHLLFVDKTPDFGLLLPNISKSLL